MKQIVIIHADDAQYATTTDAMHKKIRIDKPIGNGQFRIVPRGKLLRKIVEQKGRGE